MVQLTCLPASKQPISSPANRTRMSHRWLKKLELADSSKAYKRSQLAKQEILSLRFPPLSSSLFSAFSLLLLLSCAMTHLTLISRLTRVANSLVGKTPSSGNHSGLFRRDVSYEG